MNVSTKEIVSWIEEVEVMIDLESFDATIPMKDQGIDSLDLASLFFLIEEKTGIKISNDEVATLVTVTDIVNFIGTR